MSVPQAVWAVLWERAARDPSPFEISEAAPEVARRLGVDGREAERRIGILLQELERMPDGEQFFRREGNAVVALPEFGAAVEAGRPPLEVYPFEV